MQTFYGIIPIMNKTLHEYDKDLKPSKMKDPRLNDLIKLFFNPISYGGASEAPPSGIGDCSKTHLYIDLKVLDFSYISKTKILKKKEIQFFYPTPPRRGVLKK